ncbi:MAG: hypothetical protein KUG74_10840 [Rhodobacteraceae bacterium]|nr:hypothetical protein [Paracoccaceae bacterium]
MKDIENLATAIDLALDGGDVKKLAACVCEIDELLKDTEREDISLLWYFRANAFSALRPLRPNFAEEQFAWQQPDLSEEILSLRHALDNVRFGQLDVTRRCQILTNLGNALNTVGRPIAAIAAWDEAIHIEPNFAMAAANRAYGLVNYSAAFYDPGHQCIFLAEAAKGYRVALGADAVWDSEYPATVAEAFQAKLAEVEAYSDAHCKLVDFDPHKFDLGDTAEARSFNQWRLDERLFLNPLNDLGAWPVAAQDVFHLPKHFYDHDEEVRFPRYFDLIRQEYVAACALLYEGLNTYQVHCADQTLLTFDYADYSVSSVQIEKQKAAFRLAYSLLDKCAAFINDYFQIGHDPRSLNASFRKVWLRSGRKSLSESLPLQNWRLRGLYAASLDLFDADMKELASPLAVTANNLRNAVEHRFLSVYEFAKPERAPALSEVVSMDELEELSLHMLRLAREAIIGVSLAMHHQEAHLKPDNNGAFTVPIPIVPKRR